MKCRSWGNQEAPWQAGCAEAQWRFGYDNGLYRSQVRQSKHESFFLSLSLSVSIFFCAKFWISLWAVPYSDTCWFLSLGVSKETDPLVLVRFFSILVQFWFQFKKNWFKLNRPMGMYTYIYIYIYVYVNVYIYDSMYIFMYVYIHVHMYIYICTYMYIFTYTSTMYVCV